MTTNVGQKIKSTYKDNLKIENANAGLDTTLRDVEDNLGNASALQISTTAVNIDGTFTVSGAAIPSVASTVTLTGSQTLTNKTLTAPTINAATLSGTFAGGTFTGSTLTAPTINAATLTGTIAGGTFTGSTITSPTITSPTLTTPTLGTPASGTLTNCTGLPVATGISGFGTGIAAWLADPTSAKLATAVTNETGSGLLVFATSPTLTTPTFTAPVLGTPASGTLTNCTGLPEASITGTAWTSFTPGFTGFSANPTVTAIGKVIGKTQFISIRTTANGVSNSTSFTITGLPNASSATTGRMWFPILGTDNNSSNIKMAYLDASSTTLVLTSADATIAGWTASGFKGAYINISYEIA